MIMKLYYLVSYEKKCVFSLFRLLICTIGMYIFIMLLMLLKTFIVHYPVKKHIILYICLSVPVFHERSSYGISPSAMTASHRIAFPLFDLISFQYSHDDYLYWYGLSTTWLVVPRWMA